MPLFGSKHDKTKDTAPLDTTTGGGRHHNTAGAGNFMGGPGPMTGGSGVTGHNNPGYAADPNMNAGQGMTGTEQFGQGHYGLGANANNYGTGSDIGAPGYTHGSGPGAGGNIPPSNIVNHGPGNTTSGTASQPGGAGQRLTGKVESAIGTMVGSNALKTKGLQKEQEANAVKMQSRELAEAERLEREALMRRERAVGHAGAHPANANLGAGHTQQPPSGGGLSGTYN